MANIVINFGSDEGSKSSFVRDKISERLTQAGLEDRSWVIGPLVHPLTKEISITACVHEEKADEFFQTLKQLFDSDEICLSVRDKVKGLPDKQ